ncbi:MAG: hypothetical protein IID40_07015 [Planctomycetes bacterium]|nr:hypothetical protein [Planctomycetota bacterium]
MEVLATGVLTFVPADITITVGDSVHWTGLSLGFHSVAEVDDPAAMVWNGGFHSAAAASEFTFTFNTPGPFFYICEPHVLSAMRGSITVEPVPPPSATDWDSCGEHDPNGNEGPPQTKCIDIVNVQNPNDPCDPRADTQIEPRFFGIGSTSQSFHQIVVALNGPATGTVTMDALCTDGSAHMATVSVSTDGLTVTGEFAPPLPNTECCTMTLGGGATGSEVIKILQGDVNGSCRVNATDKNIVKGKITSRTPPLVCDDFFYDVNMSGRINATDKNLVKGRVTTANELDQSAGCGLP